MRLLGGILLLLSILPTHAFSGPGVPGSPAENLRSLAAGYYGALVVGGLGVALLAFPLALTRLPRRVGDLVGGAGERLLTGPRPGVFATVLGAASGLLALVLSRQVFAFRPALLDATSQLIHARYMAAGRLAGPELEHPEFFLFQFMVNLPSGWASQYPPAHVAMLSIGFLAGAPWIVGPALVAVTVALTARLAEELLPGDRLAARLGAVLLAVSLFFLSHAASYMNHVTAAAFGVLAILGGLRGRGEGWRGHAWLAASGIATGIVFATRPVAGLTTGVVALAALYLPVGGEPPLARLRRVARRAPLFAAGCLPPLAGLGAFNQRLFGHPARFGYLAAEGPAHGMGFHEDPWGNPYGPVDGLIQTSRDLLALGLDLLVTPVSAVILVAAFLLLGPARPRALPLLLAWALLPVVAHFFYWHQDLFMGPRLLTEFTPAWAILTAIAVVDLLRRTRARTLDAGRRFDPHGMLVSVLLLAALAGIALLVPQRIALYARQWGPDARVAVPVVRAPSIVFVQGGWSERLGARLAAQGFRVDSIREALRYNTSCEVQEFLDAREARRAGPSAPDRPDGLHFQPRPGVEVVAANLAPGVAVSTHRGEEPSPACLRQAHADRHGALEFPELLWHGDLPALRPEAAMFARDLGPELNPRLLELHPERRALVYLRPEPHLPPVLMPYEDGMDLLWNTGPESGDEAGP